MSDTLYVVTGPTASGKTAFAIDLARRLGTEIISADSRQIYKGIPIGTAQPSPEELAAVPHHLVATLPLDAYYSAAQFEADALSLLPGIFARGNRSAVLCGGSMMYIDALCNGIDPLPTVTPAIRAQAYGILEAEGLDGVISRLRTLDPAYLAAAPDLRNHKRLVHALEVTLQAGRPYSSLLTGRNRSADTSGPLRPFRIERIILEPPRDVLFDRINRRVEAMMEAGLLEEARRVYPLRHLNSLNTVGYKELFAHFDGLWDLPTAVARIQKNTRVYAKKQLTWLHRPDS